jgi:ribosomal-protein-alanine N-acetyltransferase
LLDIPAVHRLEQVIFPKDAYPYFDLALLFLWPGLMNLKATASDRSFAGYICAGRLPFQSTGWIITLGVDPAHQNRGVGRALLLRAEQRLKGPVVRLTVRESNAPAITLYRHNGYEVIDRKYGYYRDRETGLIMEKRLESG